ncbi:hypothetical protein [Escherichia coli]|nr:hypothetical protein [Escherichia coli]
MATTLIFPYETELKPPFTPDHAARTGTAVACVSSDGKEYDYVRKILSRS